MSGDVSPELHAAVVRRADNRCDHSSAPEGADSIQPTVTRSEPWEMCLAME